MEPQTERPIWDRSSQTGVLWQDIQHRYLFDYIGKAREAITAHDRAAAADLLRFLAGYVQLHFASEEEYMRMLRDPEAANHHAEHERFRADLGRALAHVDASRPEILFADTAILLDRMTDWYFTHIKAIDIRLGHLIRQYGIF